MDTITLRARRVATALLLVALSACAKLSVFEPDNQVQVSNNTNQFSLQAVGIQNQSGAESYAWVVTTATASVSHDNAALTAGTAIVTVLDAEGTEVYTDPLSEASNGTETTAWGAAGTWTVILTMTNATTDRIHFQLANIP